MLSLCLNSTAPHYLLTTFSLPLLLNRKQLMAHALAQSQLTAEDEGEAEAGEVSSSGSMAVMYGDSLHSHCLLLSYPVISCPVLSYPILSYPPFSAITMCNEVNDNSDYSVLSSLLSPSCILSLLSPPLFSSLLLSFSLFSSCLSAFLILIT